MTSAQYDPRAEALAEAIRTAERRHGARAVMRLGDQGVAATEVPVVSTGSLLLDDALGIGGLPRGRVVEVFGPESSGKTTLTLHMIAQVQVAGGTAAFVDAEHALDAGYARRLGVDTDALLVAQPDSGEAALDITETLVRSGAVDMVVVDSVAALVPRAELEGEMGESYVGLQARLMSQAMRKLTAVTARTGCIVVFINQLRQKIGVVFGNGEVTTGGNALKFYSSIRVDIRRLGAIRRGDLQVGVRTRIRVVKNKLAPPFRKVEVDIVYGTGISREGELLDLAEDHGVVSKNGLSFYLGDQKLGQGREGVREALIQDQELRARLEELVVGVAGLAGVAAEA